MMKFSKWTFALAGGLVFLTMGAMWASSSGMGLKQPTKNPISIREDSARGPTRTGHYRTRYFFMGGGFHHGK